MDSEEAKKKKKKKKDKRDQGHLSKIIVKNILTNSAQLHTSWY